MFSTMQRPALKRARALVSSSTPPPLTAATVSAPINIDTVWTGDLVLRGTERTGSVPCTAERYNVTGRAGITNASGSLWPKTLELTSRNIVPGRTVLRALNHAHVQWLVRFSAKQPPDIARLHSLATTLAMKAQAIQVLIADSTRTGPPAGMLYVFAMSMDRMTPHLPTSGVYALLAAYRPYVNGTGMVIAPRRSAAVSAVHSRSISVPMPTTTSPPAASARLPREVWVWRGGLIIIGIRPGSAPISFPCFAYRPPPSLKPSRVDARSWLDFLPINTADMVPKASLAAALEHRASYRLARFVPQTTAKPSVEAFNALVERMEREKTAVTIKNRDHNIRTLVITTENISQRGLQLVGIYAYNPADPSKPLIS